MRKYRVLIGVFCIALVLHCAAGYNRCLISAAQSTESITLTSTIKTLTAGKSFTFRAETSNSSNKITWSVSDAKKASVSREGRLTGKRAGTVTITAHAGKLEKSFTVRIKGKKRIAIDPGHQQRGNSGLEQAGPGSVTKKAKVAGGTKGAATGVPEYKLTLAVALKLREELLNRGYEVVMTRDKNDVDISNKERAIFANESGADICVRLHADGAASASAKGASALYPSKKNPYVSGISKKSSLLASSVLKSYCKKTGMKSRGIIVRDDLSGTNWSTIPVIVLEMGFMTNQAEDRLMQTESWQKKSAAGIADGIDAYY